MKVLIIGSGGREHTLAWAASRSQAVERVYVAPGNAGTQAGSKTTNVDISPTDIEANLHFCRKNQIDLTIVGPEAPLAAGLVDAFAAEGLLCFGPSAAGAKLESSKSFSKEFMVENNIPTAAYATFDNYAAARRYLQACAFPQVIKADGLAAGKGVVIANTLEEGEIALAQIMQDQVHGAAGARVVIEEFLEGEEASYMVITDLEHYCPLATSQDHKARDAGDRGPNTGGMGAYSPARVVTPALESVIQQTIIEPTLAGLKRAGITYRGFLYVGLMISPSGTVKVLEYNCRLGDPETQVIIPRLQSDLVDVCLACLNGKLSEVTLTWDPKCALGIVLASAGYPGDYEKGLPISIPPTLPNNLLLFHAGTKNQNGKLLTNGGRVMCITALADGIEDARHEALAIADQITWPGMFYREDIGHRAIESVA